MQAVGYNSVEAEDWEIATRGEDIGKLETLLLDKNRKMEHELTQFKVSLSVRMLRRLQFLVFFKSGRLGEPQSSFTRRFDVF